MGKVAGLDLNQLGHLEGRRAERRIGEMMKEQLKATGGDAMRARVSEKPEVATLSDAGIDKNLANRARKLNALFRPADSAHGRTPFTTSMRALTNRPGRQRWSASFMRAYLK